MSKQRNEEQECLRGDRGGAVMVVEYLQSIMSKELLGKFPDNSAFDFDYTQSSIWSPLIQCRKGQDLDMEVISKSLSSSSFSPTVLQRKLNYDEDDCDEMYWENETSGKCITTSVSMKKLAASFKKKIGINVLDTFKIYRDTKMEKKIRKKGFGFSPGAAAANSPKPRKVRSIFSVVITPSSILLSEMLGSLAVPEILCHMYNFFFIFLCDNEY